MISSHKILFLGNESCKSLWQENLHHLWKMFSKPGYYLIWINYSSHVQYGYWKIVTNNYANTLLFIDHWLNVDKVLVYCYQRLYSRKYEKDWKPSTAWAVLILPRRTNRLLWTYQHIKVSATLNSYRICPISIVNVSVFSTFRLWFCRLWKSTGSRGCCTGTTSSGRSSTDGKGKAQSSRKKGNIKSPISKRLQIILF